jgi:hypothetical protein
MSYFAGSCPICGIEARAPITDEFEGNYIRWWQDAAAGACEHYRGVRATGEGYELTDRHELIFAVEAKLELDAGIR